MTGVMSRGRGRGAEVVVPAGWGRDLEEDCDCGNGKVIIINLLTVSPFGFLVLA